jgi:MFS family permease
MESRQRANARNFIIHTALAGAIEGGIVAYIPVLLARLGASATTISLLNSGLALANISMALPAGPLIASQRDLVGYISRWILAIRLIFLAIALLPFFHGWWVPLAIVALWSLHGVPAALVNNGFFGILGDAVPPRDRPRLNGIRWGLFGVVAASVTGVFGLLLDVIPFPLGYQLVFAVSALFGLAGLVYFRRIVIEPRGTISATSPRRGLTNLLWPHGAGRDFLEFQILTGLLRVGLHLPIGLFSIYWVNDLQATDTWIGIRSTVANGALVVGYFAWGWVSARIGHRWTLGVSSCGMALYPALTALGPTVEWMLPAAFFWGVFVAGIDFALVEGLLRASPDERRAEFVAVHHFQANVVAFVAPLAGAWLADRTSIPFVMLIATAVHIIVLIGIAAGSLGSLRSAVKTSP